MFGMFLTLKKVLVMKKRLFFSVVLYFLAHVLFAKNMTYINNQPVITVDELLKTRTDIQYIHLRDSVELYREKNNLSQDEDRIWWEQNPVVHPKVFLLSVPYGKIYCQDGFIVVDNMYIDEFVWGPIKHGYYKDMLDIAKVKNERKIHGKIAVIAQSGGDNYYHWMVEVLPKLALLKESGVAYDYMYLPLYNSFMKETVRLLGIDTSKILKSLDENSYIQADELIIPSAPSAFGYTSEFVINFLRNTFIPLAQASVDVNKFGKRIFISRRKAIIRKIKNEKDVFALFKQHGFVEYVLEDLSVLEQVMLFYHAEIIVGEHGAGLTNIIFAQPGTKVIEIFQARERGMYWYLSQELGLEHFCVKTIPFDVHKDGNFYATIPLDPVRKIIDVCLKK